MTDAQHQHAMHEIQSLVFALNVAIFFGLSVVEHGAAAIAPNEKADCWGALLQQSLADVRASLTRAEMAVKVLLAADDDAPELLDQAHG